MFFRRVRAAIVNEGLCFLFILFNHTSGKYVLTGVAVIYYGKLPGGRCPLGVVKFENRGIR